MMDENVYRKEGRRYVPFGRVVGRDYLSDGIWYVRHGKGPCTGSWTSGEYLQGIYRICGAKDVSIDVIAGMENLANEIRLTPEIQALTAKGYSAMDIIRATIAQIIKRQTKTAK